MNQKNLFTSLILLLLLLVSSCNNGYEDCHNTVMLKNNSDVTVYYVSTLKDGFFNFDPTSEVHAAEYRIAAGESRKVKIGITLSCWEQVLENAGGNLYIYVYDAAYLDSHDWSDAKNSYLKKYSLTVDQLNKMDWEIRYP